MSFLRFISLYDKGFDLIEFETSPSDDGKSIFGRNYLIKLSESSN